MQQKSNIIIYTTEDGLTKIETTFDEDTVWLSIDQMAELFQRDKSTISRHIKISSEGELVRESVVANFATTAADGKKEFMGLTTFVGNQPTLKEAVVAENYLSEKELRAMGQLVSGYLDFAERQAEREQAMTIYINFKDFVGLGKIETEPLLAEMPAYAKRYQILLDGNSGSAALDACIDRLNRLETMVIRPYLLEVLRLYNENKLTLAQVTEIFLTTENYLFRRTMCDLPTNALNKIFLMLHREIIRYDGTEEADKVSARIAALLSEKAFSFTPNEYISIHRKLFTGIYFHAGHIRNYNITKKEWVLDGATLVRANYNDLKNGVHETTEFLELFLRNFLLNESNPLHNRTLHISGTFKEAGKPDIEALKPDIEKSFQPKTESHILKLREAFPGQTVFGRSDVMKVIDIKSSRASDLLKEMAEHRIIEPVSGHGKGKYRFRHQES